MKLLLSLAATLALAPAAALACEMCEAGGAVATSPASDSAAQGTKFTIPVEGMSCGSCANRLVSVLMQVEGVKTVDVSVADRRAVIVFDERHADPTRAVETINELGYRAGKPVKG